MDGPRDYHTKWSKPDKERQISYKILFICGILKITQMNLLTKQKEIHKQKTSYGYQRGHERHK